VGSPGFVKDAFYQYLQKEAEKKQSTFLKTMLDRMIVAHTSSGFKHSMNEILSNKTVQDKIKDLSVF